MRILLSLCIACLLASCSLTAPRDVGNANMITLSAPENLATASKKHSGLKVDYPNAPDDLDTYRIAVAKADGQPDYFAGARWNEFLPSVVQAALTETLARSGGFSYVGSDDGYTNNDYLLSTDIEECRAVYANTKTPPTAVIRIVFHLTSVRSHTALLTFRLEERSTASSNTLASIAQAFNQSFGAIASQAIAKLHTVK